MRTPRRRKYEILLSLVLVFILVSCVPSNPKSSPSPEASSTAEKDGGSTALLENPLESDKPSAKESENSTSTEDFLLSETISFGGTGGGFTPSCAEVSDARTPNVFIKQRGLPKLSLLIRSSVCLAGFNKDEAIEISVSVGNSVYRSTIKPQQDSPPVSETKSFLSPDTSPPEALFDGRELIAVPDNEYLESEKWTFVPPLSARNKLVEFGQLAITATQGKIHASTTQTMDLFALMTEPGQLILAWDGDGEKGARRALAIWGFNVGSQIPIGVYSSLGPEGDDLHLIRKIGQVTIPGSKLAVFTLPPTVLSEFATGDAEFCIAGPFKTIESCFI